MRPRTAPSSAPIATSATSSSTPRSRSSPISRRPSGPPEPAPHGAAAIPRQLTRNQWVPKATRGPLLGTGPAVCYFVSPGARTTVVAWLLTAVYYFFQYTLRSAPAVMVPQLSDAFGLTTLGVASLVGLFYYGYSPFSLVAGVALDRFGARH